MSLADSHHVQSGVHSHHGAATVPAPPTSTSSSPGFAHTVYWRIVEIVREIHNDAAVIPALEQLSDIVKLYGIDSHLFILRTFLNSSGLLSNSTLSDGTNPTILSTHKAFAQYMVTIEGLPTFEGLFIQAFEALDKSANSQLFELIVSKLKIQFTVAVRIALAFALSANLSSKKQGQDFLIQNLARLESSSELPDLILHEVIEFVLTSDQITDDRRRAFLDIMRISHPEQSSSTLLLPIMYPHTYTNAIKYALPSLELNQLEPGCSLSSLLRDLGYAACSNAERLTSIISLFPGLVDSDIAECLSMVIRTHSSLLESHDPALSCVVSMTSNQSWDGNLLTNDSLDVTSAEGAPTWNIPIFVSGISQAYPNVDWSNVFQLLDHPEFQVKDQKGMDVLLETHRLSTGEQSFPLEVLFKPWVNQFGHLSLIRMAIGCSSVDFEHSENVVRPIAGLHSVKTPAEHSKSSYGMANNSWSSLDLVQTLINLGESDLYGAVRALFNSPLEHAPELLLCALAQVRAQYSTLKEELLDILLPKYLRIHPNSGPVLARVWSEDSGLVVTWMVRLYLLDRSFLSRILDIAQDLKDALAIILEARPFTFAIDLASLASRREFLNLEKWLQLRLAEHGNIFASACLDYLAHSITRSSVPIPFESAAAFLSSLSGNLGTMSGENRIRFDEINQIIQQTASSASSLSIVHMAPITGVTALGAPAVTGDLPADNIEEIANSYFQKIYDSKISIGEVVNMLIAFKGPQATQRENDIYGCMIHNLFDEFRFFHKYPEKELRITAVLFGTLIRHELTGRFTIDTALRYIVDGLRNPPGSKLHRFGLWALDEFRMRLSEWPDFGSSLLQLNTLSDQVDLINYLRANAGPTVMIQSALEAISLSTGAQSATPHPAVVPSYLSSAVANIVPGPARPSAPVAVAAQPVGNLVLRAASSVNIDNMLGTKGYALFSALPSEVADKFSFIVNNVDAANMSAKADEIRALLQPDQFGHFAHYFVVKRVTSESTFLKTYVGLVDCLKMPALNKVLLLYTYESINILLQSATIVSLSQERSLLKNLGSFLGMLTIKRNVPPLAKYIKFKNIILDAYNRGRLIAVIPFVAKVLEHCSESRVFKPPNPWLMSLVSLLGEIYHVADLKLNLKFEIEVLLNKLGITLADISIRNYLPIVNQALNSNFRNPNEAVDIGAATNVPSVSSSAIDGPMFAARHPHSARTFANLMDDPSKTLTAPSADLPSVPQPGQSVMINPNLILFTANPRLKACVSMAVDRAINEIISPVVERSVHIACITSRELVCKDFALEADELRMRKASHQMVQSLTCSLALVTCKEPLRLSISNHLRQLLIANNADPTLTEQTVLQVANDNLEFGCSIIEKAASERAVRQIDESLQMEFEVRKKARDLHQPFGEMALAQGRGSLRFPSSVPESLRPKPGLSSSQLRVYDDFNEVRASLVSSGIVTGGSSPVGGDAIPDEVNVLMGKLHALATNSNALDDPAVHSLLASLQTFLKSTSDPDLVVTRLIQNVFPLYCVANSTPSYIDFYLSVLKAICPCAPSGIKSLTQTYLSCGHDTMFSHAVARGLFCERLIVSGDVDTLFANAILSKRLDIPAIVGFLHHGIGVERFVSPGEFPSTLSSLSRFTMSSGLVSPTVSDAIQSLLKASRACESVTNLISHIPPQVTVDANSNDAFQGDIREQFKALFQKWMSICLSQSNSLDDVFHPYLASLKSNGVLKSDGSVEEFCRVITIVCVESSVSEQSPGPQEGLSFAAIDGFCKLIVCLVKVLSGSGGVYTSKMGLLTTCLDVIADVLSRDFARDSENFNQRPYFRLFVNLLRDLNANDPDLDGISVAILTSFSKTFHDIRPALIPGFCLSWLELVSHRTFMPRLLQSKTHNLMAMFKYLLVDLFAFMQFFLRSAHLTESMKLLYKGTLRILLVLLHDFPEFLCSYHFSFCDVIPPSCIQMRNLILSAFPRNMRLPDPFMPDLKVDSLPEIKDPPVILSDISGSLVYSGLQDDIDGFMANGASHTASSHSAFFADLHAKLFRPKHEIAAAGTIYNVQLINAIVINVGQKGIQIAENGDVGIPNNSAMDLYQAMVTQLDEEGRYYFLNAIANQLRYPNNHTHYFSCVLLYLFMDARSDIIQEQITRVLLERLIVHRPHPWGLLITFIELIKNPTYRFWTHEFTRCAPEIQRLFESVSRSCMQSAPGASVAQPAMDDAVATS